MQVLNLLLLGALFGVAYCDFKCYQEKVSDCSKKVLDSTKDFGFCSLQPDMIRCNRKAAFECGSSSLMTYIEELESYITQMCQDGSYLNKEMKKHQECLTKKVLADLSCYKDIIDFTKVEPTPESMLEVQKKTCQNLDKMSSCVLDLSKKECGNDAERFLEMVYRPSVEMQREVCKEFLQTAGSVHLEYPIVYGPLGSML